MMASPRVLPVPRIGRDPFLKSLAHRFVLVSFLDFNFQPRGVGTHIGFLVGSNPYLYLVKSDLILPQHRELRRIGHHLSMCRPYS
uniref:Uncharacterized protein n=1 Tax=Triticum urartu TaxID=4572 RepID=A0A8R7PC01_TRIUA